MVKGWQDFRFSDRAEAGRMLGTHLAGLSLDRPIVYALPRGGVPVALEVSRALKAPLDLILVRKIGAPGAPELALGALVDGASPQMVINEEVRRHTRVTDDYLQNARARELRELERRRVRYLGQRGQTDPRGRTVIIVDDGLATGATMKAALIAMKRQGAGRTCVAVPVAPADVAAEMRTLADLVVCLNPAPVFYGVGGFYDDFHQLSDEETVSLLQQGWSDSARAASPQDDVSRRQVAIPPLGLPGELTVPEAARGLVLFAHGSGSSRLSPRNRAVADDLNACGFATLLFDLLTPAEAADRKTVFDIALLAERIVEAVLYSAGEPDVSDLPVGLFGASTGGGAALVAAAELTGRIVAVVSRGGRPDLAGPRLQDVGAATLLIVGGEDHPVIAANRQALAALRCEKQLEIIPGAGHLFEEPGTLDAVAQRACAWFERHLTPAERRAAGPVQAAAEPDSLLSTLRRTVQPLPEPEEPGFAAAFDRYGSARVVLLGEATHGTSEFYRARAAITRRLIENHGFTIVAVEADWPDAAAIDRSIDPRPRPAPRTPPFTRFPTWMWRNREAADFTEVLRRHNAQAPRDSRVRFYGLDLYGMNASIAEVLGYLDRVDPEAGREARARYACFDPWTRELAGYGRAALSRGHAVCEEQATRTLIDLLQKELHYAQQGGDDFFDAVQNARLVADAERYYRAMYHASREAWNLRDRHMFDTLKHSLDRAGQDGKAVVWAHNSHIGDARFTEMGTTRGELNLGQLCREAWGEAAVLVGFGTHAGTVAAASEWDAPVDIKTVRPSRPDSHEALCHEIGYPRFLLPMGRDLSPSVRTALTQPRLERYIGVIYRPETERWSHYSEASLAEEYDAFVWFDETRAVTPLSGMVGTGDEETYPFGL